MLVADIQCRKDTRPVLRDSGVIENINTALTAVKTWAAEQHISVRLKGAGDLAWCSLALGKEAKSGHHCWRCQAMWKEFQSNPSKQFTKWTLNSMREHYDKLERGELDRRIKSQERGLTHSPLIDCIEPKDWLCPVLHSVDLLMHHLITCRW